MQKLEKNNSNNRILILADFSEGGWTAARFAMEHLYQPGSIIYILQTWQKPSYGSSMVRDLTSILQNITNSELKALKRKMLSIYPDLEKDIHLLSVEGELSQFFESDAYLNHQWQLVMSTKYKNGETSKNPRFTEIIDQVNQPLYLLNDIDYVDNIPNVFLMTSNKMVSSEVLNVLQQINAKQYSNIQVCLEDDTISQLTKEKQIKLVSNVCTNSKLRFSKLCSDNGLNQIREYERKRIPNLMIFDKNRNRKIQNKLKNYLDRWLVKSKGISIGTY
ncbi:hypothetical protein GCQ56_08240 [Marinifilum sp. N1E240]|uniref:hypothetical protein n=1 Tax=Marinifilum sp. N1E240 TaxID=2608082 RepID=UPI00128BAFCA|nr:hypothetical protein [Marinifilum sp. N1E240]MPQ47003.1 hypothetical protein [Marinifilum sp. N1E240]